MFKSRFLVGMKAYQCGHLDEIKSTPNFNGADVPNDCCGARVENGQHFNHSRMGGNRDFGSAFYWTHTVGIRYFLGKVVVPPTLYPNEKLVEVELGGETLTIAYVATWFDLKDVCEVDPKRGAYSHCPGDKTELLLTNATVPLVFPVFNSFCGEGRLGADQENYWRREFGYSVAQAKAYVQWNSQRFQTLHALHLAGEHLVFTVTTTQLQELKKKLLKYEMQDSVVFEQSNIANMNYSEGDNPRLAIVVVKGA